MQPLQMRPHNVYILMLTEIEKQNIHINIYIYIGTLQAPFDMLNNNAFWHPTLGGGGKGGGKPCLGSDWSLIGGGSLTRGSLFRYVCVFMLIVLVSICFMCLFRLA